MLRTIFFCRIAADELNKLKRHDLGNQLLESAEKHRIKKYLEEDLGFYEAEEETYLDVLTKRELVDKTFKSEETKDLKYNANTLFTKELKKLYEKGNKRLETHLTEKLPESYNSLVF